MIFPIVIGWPCGRAVRRREPLILLLAVIGLGVPRLVFANGGVTQLAREASGPYLLTVTTSPTPLRVGSADVSVLVERSETQDIVLDAEVNVAAAPTEGTKGAGFFPATHDQAVNKLLYSANVELTEPGRWQFAVHVTGNLGDGTAGFQADVLEPSILDQPFVIPFAVAIVIGALVWWSMRLPRRRG